MCDFLHYVIALAVRNSELIHAKIFTRTLTEKNVIIMGENKDKVRSMDTWSDLSRGGVV